MADDERSIRALVSTFLQRAFPGSDVLVASSGEEGLAILREQTVDLIISDHRMGGLDGVSMLVEARALAPSTLRILLTGHADGEMAQRAINDGHIHAFFQKPVRCGSLVSKVERLLADRALRCGTQRAFALSLELAAAIQRKR